MALRANGHLSSDLVTLQHTITVRQGETFRKQITWKVNDVAVILTGYQARMQIRAAHSSDDIWVDLTVGDGIEFNTPATDGVINLHIESTTTETLLENGVYDLKVWQAGGDSKTLIEGAVILKRAVTRDPAP